MRSYCIILTFLLPLAAGSQLLAQNSSIFVLRVQGKVDYYATRDAKAVRLTSSQKLGVRGAIHLHAGASAKLQYGENTYDLDEAGAYDLPTLISQQSTSKSLGFASRFWSFVSEGIRNTDDKQKLEKYHRQYLSRVGGGIEGFGQFESILTNQLAYGRIGDSTLTLIWRSTGIDSTYDFYLLREFDGAAVLALSISDTSLTVPLDSLTVGEYYRWQIRQEAADPDTLLMTQSFAFSYEPDRQRKSLKELPMVKDYREALPLEQRLMEAQVMEKQNFLYYTERLYQELLNAHPEDEMVQRLFAAFLARKGQVDRAEQILEQRATSNE